MFSVYLPLWALARSRLCSRLSSAKKNEKKNEVIATRIHILEPMTSFDVEWIHRHKRVLRSIKRNRKSKQMYTSRSPLNWSHFWITHGSPSRIRNPVLFFFRAQSWYCIEPVAFQPIDSPTIIIFNLIMRYANFTMLSDTPRINARFFSYLYFHFVLSRSRASLRIRGRKQMRQ